MGTFFGPNFWIALGTTVLLLFVLWLERRLKVQTRMSLPGCLLLISLMWAIHITSWYTDPYLPKSRPPAVPERWWK